MNKLLITDQGLISINTNSILITLSEAIDDISGTEEKIYAINIETFFETMRLNYSMWANSTNNNMYARDRDYKIICDFISNQETILKLDMKSRDGLNI